MRIKYLILFLSFIMTASFVNAQNVLNYKIGAKQAAASLPEFADASCKFTQEKTIKNTSSAPVILKSGGDFKFVKSKGVIFETTYPVHTVSSYTSSQNKQVSAIIKAISEKNYSYLEKNFDIFYLKTPADWEIALKPKKDSKTASQMKMIYIKGKTHISKMNIETVNSKTSIQFTECR